VAPAFAGDSDSLALTIIWIESTNYKLRDLYVGLRFAALARGQTKFAQASQRHRAAIFQFGLRVG
jgi:hypothetical protein